MKDNTNELLNHVDATNIDSMLEHALNELKKAEQNFDYLKKLKESINKFDNYFKCFILLIEFSL